MTAGRKAAALYAALLVLPCLLIAGLDPQVAVTQYVMKSWTIDDGLPQNSVTCLLQTRDGYLWIGTGNGLARFDGAAFDVFSARNVPAIRLNDVRSLFEDSRGRLWVEFTNDLVYLQNGEFRRLDPEIGPGAVFENTPGEVLLINRTGLYAVSENSPSLVDPGIKAPDFLFYCRHPRLGLILFDSGGARRWVRGGLETVAAFTMPPEATSAFIDGSGRPGYIGWGIAFLSDGETFHKLPLSDEAIRIGSVFCDSRSDLWFVSLQGLFRYHDGRIDLFDKTAGLTDDGVLSVMEDREGSLWVGTRRGLTRIKNPRARTYSSAEGLDCPLPRSVFEDRQGNLWVSGNECGIQIFRNGRSFYPFGSQSRTVSPFYEDGDGALWLGGTLSRYHNGVIQPFVAPDGGKITNVRAILRDRSGILWVGTQVGLYRLENGRVEHIGPVGGRPDPLVFCIHETSAGDLWVGTDQGVLIRDETAFRPLLENDALARAQVMAVMEDGDGVLWLATYAGLFRRGPEGWFRFTSEHGLPVDEMLGILEDDGGRIWMSSMAGIVSIPKADLTDLARGGRRRLAPLVLDAGDGMKNIEGNSGFQPSSWKARDGRLWFPTMGGIVVVDPAEVWKDAPPPDVRIKTLFVNGVDAGALAPAEVSRAAVKPTARRIEIRFAVLHFAKPESLRIRYRLWGYDKDWVELSGRADRVAQYTNLPGGKYRLQVAAATDTGAWNDEGDSVAFVKTRAVHETVVFKAAVLLAGLALLQLGAGFIKRYFFLFAFWKKKSYLGQYALLKLIGQGATSSVFLARGFLKRDKPVAVKVLRKACTADPTIVKRFKQESAITDRLDHPHIVKVLERGQHEGSHYIVMEHLEGRTLADTIRETRPFPLADVPPIMIQLSDILTALHVKGVVHRDLKPSNIMMLDESGDKPFVKLLDFGLARAQYHTHMTESGSLLGTVPYIPPEQIGMGVFSPAGDVYALGVIAYEMTTGATPFKDCGEFEILRRKLEETPPPPATLRPDIPEPMDRLIAAMMEIDPDKRPGAEDLLEAWRRIAADFEAGRFIR